MRFNDPWKQEFKLLVLREYCRTIRVHFEVSVLVYEGRGKPNGVA